MKTSEDKLLDAPPFQQQGIELILKTLRESAQPVHIVSVSVRNDGIYEFRETTKLSNFSVYYRGDPRENEAALCDALPALYLSFRSTTSQ
jgi:hypothetical protein